MRFGERRLQPGGDENAARTGRVVVAADFLAPASKYGAWSAVSTAKSVDVAGSHSAGLAYGSADASAPRERAIARLAPRKWPVHPAKSRAQFLADTLCKS